MYTTLRTIGTTRKSSSGPHALTGALQPGFTRAAFSLVFAISLVVAAAAAGPARADNYQLFSAGVGTTLGGSHVAAPSGRTESSFSSELSLRMRAVYVLGLDFAYAPIDGSTRADGLVFGNALRLSALLYVVPTEWVQIYGKVGLEADDFAGLFTIEDNSNAYHAGGGMEVPVTDNWVLSLEFLMLIPGVASVENHVGASVEEQIARVRTAGEAALAESAIPEVSDYVSGANFRLTAGVRYYF
ncbi:MAG: hypothetical protein IV100_32680 [Myxococcales bacterium]|nr:hypothetical protein [Myxococcales bacterium]